MLEIFVICMCAA